MKRAFKAPPGAWIAFCILAVIGRIPTFTKATQTNNPDLFIDGFGRMIGWIISLWLIWAAGKGAWLGIRALHSSQKRVSAQPLFRAGNGSVPRFPKLTPLEEMLMAAANQPPPYTSRAWSGAVKAIGGGLMRANGLLASVLPKPTPLSWDVLKAVADRPPPFKFGSWSGAAKALGVWLLVLSGLGLAIHFQPSQLVHPSQPVKSPKPVLHTTEVAVGTAGAMFFLMATVNGLEMPFMVDSGSSDICLPDILIGDLRRRGLLTDADRRGSGQATLADGRVVPSKTYNLAQVTIGTWTLDNVAASSCGKSKIPLLGQSVLGRFTSWSLDNQRNVLILTGFR